MAGAGFGGIVGEGFGAGVLEGSGGGMVGGVGVEAVLGSEVGLNADDELRALSNAAFQEAIEEEASTALGVEQLVRAFGQTKRGMAAARDHCEARQHGAFGRSAAAGRLSCRGVSVDDGLNGPLQDGGGRRS